MDFRRKVAVITGATSGIGESTAHLLLEKGATVLALGRNEEKGQELEKIGDCKFYKCDFSDSQSIEGVCEEILTSYPIIDILINSAGISVSGTVETLTLEEWNQIYMVNVTSIFLMGKYILPALRKSDAGRIVNIGSTAGTVGAAGLHAYATTKGAVIQLSKSMACEYAKEKILVNCVCPGGTVTPMLKNMKSQNMDKFTELFPIERLADPREIAEVIAFAASDEASFMAGSVLLVDGGFTCV